MNLLCPNCQKMLTIPEQHAGELMKCPLCSGTFTVPALPQAPVSTYVAAAAGPSAPPTPSPDVYAAAPVQDAKPRLAPPVRETVRRGNEVPEPPRSQATEKPAPPVLSPHAEHRAVLALDPRVLAWTMGVALGLLFILLFVPWVGAYPGGYVVYTQNAWQTIFGGFTSDPVGEKVLEAESDLQNAIGANWLMLLQPLLLLAVIVLAVAPFVLARTSYQLPPNLQRILPWRKQLLAGLSLLALVMVILQMMLGFGLQNAAIAVVDQKLESERQTARTPEEQQIWAIRRGMEIGRYNLRHTSWLSLAVVCYFMIVASSGLEVWLERRSDRPLPRVDVHW